MNNDRTVIACALLVAVLTLTGAGATMARIGEMRRELDLALTADLSELPPHIALSQVALGSFRGLATDVLWSRAHDLEQAGRFHEAMQLSRWISQLQPHFPRVWGFQAFNMAYNISVTSHQPEERWMWVSAAIRLLRDEAIPLNPKSISLPFELSRIYSDKIGDVYDDMHLHYKQVLAAEWHEILGPPPEGDREAFARWLEPLAASPRRLDQLLAAHPETVAELARLHAAGYQPNREMLRRILDVDQIRTYEELGFPIDPAARDRLAGLADWWNAPTGRDERVRLIAFARAQLVRSVHLDPAIMIDLTRRDGPLDWRDPSAHALYWAEIGRRVLTHQPELAAREEHEFWNIHRMMLKAGKNLFMRGTIVFDHKTGYYRQVPNPAFFELYARVSDEALRSVPPDRTTVVESFRENLKNFRVWALWVFYYYGALDRAREVHELLKAEYPNEYTGTLEEEVQRVTLEGLAGKNHTPENVRQAIGGFLTQGIERGLAIGRPEVFERFAGQARRIRDTAFRLAGPGQLTNEDVPPVVQQAADAYLRFMLDVVADSRGPRPPSQVLPMMIARRKAWLVTPVELRREVYDRMMTRLAPLKMPGLDPTALFPEPPGMAEKRAAQPPPK